MCRKTIERELLEKVLSLLDEWQIAEMIDMIGKDTELGGMLCGIAERDCHRKDRPVSTDDLKKLLQREMDAAEGYHREFFRELIHFVDRAGKTDSQLYNEIGMNRTLWYRLRDKKDARTSKRNILKMAVCLRLDYWETYYFVNLSGWPLLSRDDGTDHVVSFCIRNKVYDKSKIDELLVESGEKPLFSEI